MVVLIFLENVGLIEKGYFSRIFSVFMQCDNVKLFMDKVINWKGFNYKEILMLG